MNEIVLYLAIGFGSGVVLVSVMWAVIGGNKMKKVTRHGKSREEIVAEINESCSGLTAFLSSINMRGIDLESLGAGLEQRLSAIRASLLDQREILDFYYVQFIERFLADHRQVIDKINGLRDSVQLLSGTAMSAAAQPAPATVEAASAPRPAPAPLVPAVAAVVPPQEAQPPAGTAENDFDMAAEVPAEEPVAEEPQLRAQEAVAPPLEPQADIAAEEIVPVVMRREPEPEAVSGVTADTPAVSSVKTPQESAGTAKEPAVEEFPLFTRDEPIKPFQAAAAPAEVAKAPVEPGDDIFPPMDFELEMEDTSMSGSEADEAEKFIFGGVTPPPAGPKEQPVEETPPAAAVDEPPEAGEDEEKVVLAFQQNVQLAASAQEKKNDDDSLISGDDLINQIDSFFGFK